MDRKARMDTLSQQIVELLVKERPSYYEAQQALEIAGLLLSNTTYPVLVQERSHA